jgi:UDP-glucose 4-epimerase
VAEIVCRVIEHRRRGTLNIATGEVCSFRDIAERVAAMAKPVVAIRRRQREMPHGGYRPFDIAACRRAFADFRYTSLADGLNRAGGGQRKA